MIPCLSLNPLAEPNNSLFHRLHLHIYGSQHQLSSLHFASLFAKALENNLHFWPTFSFLIARFSFRFSRRKPKTKDIQIDGARLRRLITARKLAGEDLACYSWRFLDSLHATKRPNPPTDDRILKRTAPLLGLPAELCLILRPTVSPKRWWREGWRLCLLFTPRELVISK